MLQWKKRKLPATQTSLLSFSLLVSSKKNPNVNKPSKHGDANKKGCLEAM